MEPNLEQPAKGKLLVAEPLLGDPTFDRTIILLTEHNDEGTVGFVLNKPLDLTINHLFNDFPKFDAAVHYGGPVQKESLYFIHNKGELIPDSIDLGNNIFWSGRLDIVKNLVEVELINKNEIKFFLGYSGWGKQQLKTELEENTWVVLENTILDIFKEKDNVDWKTILTNLGGDYKLWANAPSDPLMN